MTHIAQLVRRAVQIGGEKPATVFSDSVRTWRQFEDRVRRLAGALQQLGVRRCDRIGILALNSDCYLECIFGLSYGGFVFVPINTRLAVAEMAFCLDDSGCEALFVEHTFASILPQLLPKVPQLRHVITIGHSNEHRGSATYEALLAHGEAIADPIGHDNDLAGIFYTGGTTGRSKGVMLSHANFMANVLNTYPGAPTSETTRYAHAAPMFHIADNAMTFKVTGLGGTHYFLPRFEPGALLELISRNRITHLVLVPTMLRMLVHHPDFLRHNLSSLEQLSFGGSSMPEALLQSVIELLPNTKLVQAYGLSEASPVMTQLEHRYNTLVGPYAGKTKSAGRAVIGCEVRILDENDEEVPRGTVGEICGRGDMVMLGYWKLPEVTAQTLRNGWLHTGDAGCMDNDGFVYVVDRKKDMIISGGENVYSTETEAALYSHPAVAECAVIGVPDEKWGERVHAVVLLKQGEAVTPEELIAHARKLIASYKCPRTIEFRSEPFPLTGAGKIIKTELRRPYWEGSGTEVN